LNAVPAVMRAVAEKSLRFSAWMGHDMRFTVLLYYYDRVRSVKWTYQAHNFAQDIPSVSDEAAMRRDVSLQNKTALTKPVSAV
jgi:hypothetical protein